MLVPEARASVTRAGTVCLVLGSVIYMVTDGAAVAMGVVAGVLLWLNFLVAGISVYRPTRTDLWYLALMVALALPAVLRGGRPQEFLLPVGSLGAWVGLRNVFRDEDTTRSMLRGLQAAAVLAAAAMIVRLLGGTELHRLGAFGGSQNQTAILLFVGAFVSGRDFIEERRQGSLVALIALLGALVLTTGRSSWLALLLGTGVYITRADLSAREYRRAVVAGTIGISLLALLTLAELSFAAPAEQGPLAAVYERVTYYTQKGFSGRNVLWSSALEMARGSPVVGYGWDFAEMFRRSLPEDEVVGGGGLLSPHNTWLNLFLRAGVLGCVVFLGLLLHVWRELSDQDGGLADVVLSLVAGMLFISFFESLSLGGFVLRNMIFTLLIAGAVAVATDRHGTNSASKTSALS